MVIGKKKMTEKRKEREEKRKKRKEQVANQQVVRLQKQ